MGQKSQKKKQASAKKRAAVVAPILKAEVAEQLPSLIAQSATFQPKSRGPVVEDLLQVRRTDILKIGFLILVMAVFLIAADIVNDQTNLLQSAGQRLSHVTRLQ